MQIPLVAVLWKYSNFTGYKRYYITNASDITRNAFNDEPSSIVIHPGPDYDSWKASHQGREPVVAFYQHINYGGAILFLKAGSYANLFSMYNFNNTISSLKMPLDIVIPPAGNIKPIQLVVELYTDINYGGVSIILIQNSPNLQSEFGPDFENKVSSVKVIQGPNYTAGKKAKLFAGVNFPSSGPSVELGPGNYPSLVSMEFNDVISSVKFI